MFLCLSINLHLSLAFVISHNILTNTYSTVPNKQVGWNKGVGWKKVRKSIKELDRINKLVRKTKNELVRNLKILKTFFF